MTDAAAFPWAFFGLESTSLTPWLRHGAGALIDYVSFVFDDGSQAEHGGSGGTPQPTFVLEPGEHSALRSAQRCNLEGSGTAD